MRDIYIEAPKKQKKRKNVSTEGLSADEIINVAVKNSPIRSHVGMLPHIVKPQEQKVSGAAIDNRLKAEPIVATAGNGCATIVSGSEDTVSKTELQDSKKETKRLKAEITVLKRSNASVQKKLEVADERNKELSDRMAQIKADLRTTKKGEESLEKRCKFLEAAEKELKSTNSMLTKNIKVLNRDAGTKKATEADNQTLKKLNEENKVLAQKVYDLEHQIETLTMESDMSAAKNQKAADSISVAEIACEMPTLINELNDVKEIKVSWYAKTCLYSKLFISKRYSVHTNARLNTILLKPSDTGIECVSGILDIPAMELCDFTGDRTLNAKYADDGESIVVFI